MSNFDDNRDWANNISDLLEHTDKESILEYFYKLEDKWQISTDFVKNFSQICKNFKVDDNLKNIDANFIETEKNKSIWELTGVYNKFKSLIELNEEEDDYKVRWEKLFETFYYSERLIRTTYLLNRITSDKYNYTLNEDSSTLFKFVPINSDKNTAFQNLLLYLLEELTESEFARYNDTLYKKIVTPDGYNTYAWESHLKINKYIIDKCKKNYKFDQWKNMTANSNNIRQCVEYLSECPDEELLELVKDRHIFSYRNGLYLTKINKGTKDNKVWGTLFIPHGTKSEYISKKSVACKYFDRDFNDFPEIEEENWFEIIKTCKNFKKVLDYQEFPEDVQKWLVILMGRCAYEIGELDNWSIVKYLLGQGGSGKTTILMKILLKFFDEEDVGIISNNIETKYGLKPNINKKLVLAPEIQGDCKLDQTDWQLVVEGGKSSFAEKFKTAESEYWKVPMAMAGNQLPKYKNSGEQVSRRTVVFNFWKKVKNTDTNLDKKLEKEIPNIMKLCITGYLSAVNKYGDVGIWNVLPQYFHENKDQMDETTNALQNFLRSSKIVLNKDKYVPEKVFKQAFNEHCRENNLTKEQWSFDYYSNTFSNNNIQIKKSSRRKYPMKNGELSFGTFFVGLDIQDEYDEDNKIEIE